MEEISSRVSELLASLSLREKIAQLVHIAGYSNRNATHEQLLLDQIKQFGIGGIIFFQGTPKRQVEITNACQKASKVPLMISIDAEWGLGMRLDNAMSFPYQIALGAISDNRLIYEMGREIARQCKRIGVHVNFAPVVDINNNPKNPVIGFRSFGENKYQVAEKAVAYMRGLQDGGVMACGKHFPGHGDTATDSHFSLPVISHHLERLEEIEFFPFRKLIENGVWSMMIAHLYLPQLEKQQHTASTLSKNIVDGILKDHLGFKGLVFTDALDMKGVKSHHQPGVVDKLAFMAGNDVLLFSENVAEAINQIEKGLNNGEITEKEIESRCKKVLLAKEALGVLDQPDIEADHLEKDLFTEKAIQLNIQLFGKSITRLTINKKMFPFTKEEKVLSIAWVNEKMQVPGKGTEQLMHHLLIKDEELSEESGITAFQAKLIETFSAEYICLKSNEIKSVRRIEEEKLTEYDKVIVSLHGLALKPINQFGISAKLIELLALISSKAKTLLILPTSPYALECIPCLSNFEEVLVTYQENSHTITSVIKSLKGEIKPEGRLPVTVKGVGV